MPTLSAVGRGLLTPPLRALGALLLALFALLLAVPLPAQQTTVLFENSTGALTRPAAATFRSANDIQSASGAASSYQPLSANLTSWAAVGRASGFDTFVATPSSANLASLLTNETGTGAAVFANTPTLVTPNIGAATGTSLNVTGDITLGGSLIDTGPLAISSGGLISLTAGGSNQNITLTPSGTGTVLSQANLATSGAAFVARNNSGTSRITGYGWHDEVGIRWTFLQAPQNNATLDLGLRRAGSSVIAFRDGAYTGFTGDTFAVEITATQLRVNHATASTSTTTGSAVFAGGVGVAGRTSTATLNVGGTNGTTSDLIASATATLDYPSIAAATEATLTITVTGAAVGDSVSVGWGAVLPDGIVVKQYWVSATNTVSIRVRNETAGAIDPASQTVRATVISF